VKLDPIIRKFLRLGLIGFGALTMTSALVNIIAASQLIDAAEEQSLGITRNEFVGTYGVMFAIGAAVVVAGWRWRK
jgi:hypothetical protein